MAGAGAGQKQGILLILKILLEKTDEEHTLNASGIIRELQKYHVEIDRRTVYADIEILNTFDEIEILKADGRYGGYYAASRRFELPELKLMVDAVQSSRFITVKKSRELIRKIESLASDYQAKTLNREVYIQNRVKTANENIYYNVDRIHDAIEKDLQISFLYTYWTPEKKLIAKKGGQRYIISPWAVTYDDDNYYMIGYDEPANRIKFYRVDKMLKVSVLKSRRKGEANFEGFDLAAFSAKTFGMFGGEDTEVTLRCANPMAGVIIDRFGTGVMMIPDGVSHFRVRVTVSVSRQFYGWLTGIGGDVVISAPQRVREGYLEYLAGIEQVYR